RVGRPRPAGLARRRTPALVLPHGGACGDRRLGPARDAQRALRRPAALRHPGPLVQGDRRGPDPAAPQPLDRQREPAQAPRVPGRRSPGGERAQPRDREVLALGAHRRRPRVLPGGDRSVPARHRARSGGRPRRGRLRPDLGAPRGQRRLHPARTLPPPATGHHVNQLSTPLVPPHTGRLRVAVVGAGYVAGHHLAALSELDFVEVVAICDTRQDAARALAQRFGVERTAATLAEVADARPDAVHVLTPPASHATIALEALAMGCHVLVEKPMADTVADCERMIAAARARGRILGVNHSDLLDPVLRRAVDAAAEGRIGEVLSVDVIRASDYPPYAGGPLPAQVSQGSYPFRDLGVHGLY